MLVALLMAAINETNVKGVLVICQRSSLAREDTATETSLNFGRSTRRCFPEGGVVVQGYS